MKKVLGIMLAVFSCAVLFVLLVLNGIAEGLTLGLSILTVLLAIGIIFLSVAWVYFIVWLLT